MKLSGICIWGDSIAKGVIYDEARGRYVVSRESCLAKLGRELGVPISNYSVMGQTSENGLARMRTAAMKPGEVAVIEYGGNDCDLDWKAVSEHPEARQQGKVPIDRFERNMEEMVHCAQEAGMHPVLVTPPPLVSKRYFDWVCRGLNAENILEYLGDVEAIQRWQADYAERIRMLAAKLGVLLVDIRGRMLELGGLEDMMCIDGIHPNERGHAAIYESIAALVL